MAKRTRIVGTLGPAADNESTLRSLLLAGVDVARIDVAHGTRQEHQSRIERLKRVRQELDRPCAILLDIRGPEIRTGLLDGGRPVLLRAGDHFTLTEEQGTGCDRCVSQSCAGLDEHVEPGTTILLDDGAIELAVDDHHAGNIFCTVQSTGTLGQNKTVNLPGTTVPLPTLTDRDRDDLVFGIEQGVDFVTAPFVRDGDDVRRVRMFLEANGGAGIKVVAKIETADAIENIGEIASAADAVLLSRAVLSLEMPPFDVPHVQKEVVRVCNEHYKPVIIAAQLLDSMCRKPVPTRAEVGDVANAIYDGADALMLSEETATGLYPVNAVQTMAGIAEASEAHLDVDGPAGGFSRDPQLVAPTVGVSAVQSADSLGAACIVTPTTTGRTARLVSKLRPSAPIFAVAPTPEVLRSMQLYWGVTGAVGNASGDLPEVIDGALAAVRRAGFVVPGDLVVVTGGDRRTTPHLDRARKGSAAGADAFAPTNAMYVVEVPDADSKGGVA